jgi:hypothetical protein
MRLQTYPLLSDRPPCRELSPMPASSGKAAPSIRDTRQACRRAALRLPPRAPLPCQKTERARGPARDMSEAPTQFRYSAGRIAPSLFWRYNLASVLRSKICRRSCPLRPWTHPSIAQKFASSLVSRLCLFAPRRFLRRQGMWSPHAGEPGRRGQSFGPDWKQMEEAGYQRIQ